MDFNPHNPFSEENRLEAMQKLFRIEPCYMAAEGYSNMSNTLSSRDEAVQMIKHYAQSCFLESVIPFLAVNYFDRFIARKPFPVLVRGRQENLQLFTTCCFLIAWKMRSYDFFPSEFLVEQELKFKMEQVLEMELVILGELKWRTRSVTALCFLDFFIGLIQLNDEYKDLKYYATEKIYRNQYEIRYSEFKPSIIAASALLFSFAFQLRANLSDFKQFINAICSCDYVEPESLYRCMPKSMGEECLKHILTSRSVSQANVASGSSHGATSPPLETSDSTDPTTEPMNSNRFKS